MDDSGPHLRKDSLRLLCIGSSYSLDGTIFLPQLMEDNGMGHYILGMTWFETFCKPVYGKSCLVREPSKPSET